MARTTWNKELAELLEDLEKLGEPDVIIAKAPADEAVWDQEFGNGYGGSEGAPVLAWSEEWVYFPVVYDGAEWLERAPRHPRATGQRHVGGE